MLLLPPPPLLLTYYLLTTYYTHTGSVIYYNNINKYMSNPSYEHELIQNLLHAIGDRLGYISKKEYKIRLGTKDKYIDNVWISEGKPIFFEIIVTGHSVAEDLYQYALDHDVDLVQVKAGKRTDQNEVYLKAKELFDEGCSISEIAQRLRKKRSTVYSWIKEGSKPQVKVAIQAI